MAHYILSTVSKEIQVKTTTSLILLFEAIREGAIDPTLLQNKGTINQNGDKITLFYKITLDIQNDKFVFLGDITYEGTKCMEV